MPTSSSRTCEAARASDNQAGAGAPPDSSVSLDGRPLGVSSLGVAMPVNPGMHRIVVSAAGRGSFATDVRMDEGDAQVADVAPGVRFEPLVRPSTSADESHGGSFLNLDFRRLLALGVGGVGVVGSIVGVGTGVAATSKHNALANACTGDNCPSSAQGDLDGFHSLKTASTIFYAIGFAGVAGGVALWLTAPRTSPRCGPRCSGSVPRPRDSPDASDARRDRAPRRWRNDRPRRMSRAPIR